MELEQLELHQRMILQFKMTGGVEKVIKILQDLTVITTVETKSFESFLCKLASICQTSRDFSQQLALYGGHAHIKKLLSSSTHRDAANELVCCITNGGVKFPSPAGIIYDEEKGQPEDVISF